MNEFFQGVWAGILAMPMIEVAGTITGLLCVWLTAKEKMLSWPIGIANILIFIYMFYDVKLYSDMLLNLAFFLPMNIYGWYYWAQNRGRKETRPTTHINIWELLITFAFGVIGGMMLGHFMATQTDASYPYIDAMTTSFSVVAQWFLGRKVLENWFFWIAVDIVDIWIYYQKDLYLTSALYFVFLCICIKGYRDWKREMSYVTAG